MAMKYTQYIPQPETYPNRKFFISKNFNPEEPKRFVEGLGQGSAAIPQGKISFHSTMVRQSPYYSLSAEGDEQDIDAYITFDGSYTNWWQTVIYGGYFQNGFIRFGGLGVNENHNTFDATYRITREIGAGSITYSGSTSGTQSLSSRDLTGFSYPQTISALGMSAYPDINGEGDCYVDTDFPIFDTYEHYREYVLSNGEDLSNCLNIGEEDYDLDETKLFWIYNKVGTANVTYGNIDVTNQGTWKSMKFYANAGPCFYMASPDSFSMVLRANKVVSSIGMAGPSYMLDYVPETDWRQGELYYTSGFYGNIDKYKKAFASIPTNSSYTYGVTCDTNIPVFANEQDADDYLAGTGDLEKALNYQDISKYYEKDIDNKTGVKENLTQFGEVYTRAFFSQMYLCTAAAVQEVSNALFDYDVPTLSGQWAAIKLGLEMYGSNPMEVIQGLRYYPFDLSSVFQDVGPQNYLWIGAYQLSMSNSVLKIVHMNGYIDLGHIQLKRTYNDWRDFEPYTKLSVYLPYVGRFPLDASRYYNKNINVRYYIDLRTGACCACLIADGILLDWFDGIIGTEMPITLTDYSSYAQNQLNIIMRNAGIGAVGEAKVGNLGIKGVTGAINSGADKVGSDWSNGYVGARQAGLSSASAAGAAEIAAKPAGNAMAAGVAGAAIGGAAMMGVVAAGVAMKTTFDVMKDGISGYTKCRPASSAMINQYLPQYPTFMFEIKEINESEYLNELYGRPSNKSGTLGSFSGYLECEDVMLICPIATDNERQEIIDLVRSGIYL